MQLFPVLHTLQNGYSGKTA